jgi:hypothetical protein
MKIIAISVCRFLWWLYGSAMTCENWLNRTERQKNLGYSAAITEAEGASEREAALALKRDVVSTHWAWGSD